jgi:hypothetical protein
MLAFKDVPFRQKKILRQSSVQEEDWGLLHQADLFVLPWKIVWYWSPCGHHLQTPDIDLCLFTLDFQFQLLLDQARGTSLVSFLEFASQAENTMKLIVSCPCGICGVDFLACWHRGSQETLNS